ncbi:hypothetical protein DFH11DRAFT_1578632 [Phellopilus nigrolimitatus]|nr:hypothetical protein DFH11DRAFT_1578632 [Phellopilus nigrolimitatus]
MRKRDSEELSSGERSPKRHKPENQSDIFDDTSRERQWSDIERALADTDADADEPGWISGKICMIYALKNKSDAVLAASDGRTLKISVTCPEYALFKFGFQQIIRLSLRGACLVKSKSGSSAPNVMPFSLIFANGAAIKFVSGGGAMEDGQVVDVWQVRAVVQKNEEHTVNSPKDWFSTPTPSQQLSETRSREGSESARLLSETASSPSTSFPETPGGDDLPESSVTISNGGDVSVDAQDDAVPNNAEDKAFRKSKSSERSSGREPTIDADTTRKIRRVRKRDKRHDKSEGALPQAEATTSGSLEVNSESLVKKTRYGRKARKKELAQAAADNVPLPPPPPKRDLALDLTAGVSSENGAYPALNEINANSFTQVIGVVVAIEEPGATRNGDMKVSLTIVDPSKFYNGAGFKITCFMRKGYEQCLPSPAEGHVVLLRNVKTSLWAGNVNGTVYPEKVQWVAFNPSTGKVYFPPATVEMNCFGPAFDPLHRAKREEITYFVQLGEWWRAVKEEQEHGAIQIEEYTRKRREHRLIGDCNIDEFFDATVEVLLRFDKDEHDQTVLLLSDYTPHRLRSNNGPYGQYAVSASTSKIAEDTIAQMVVGSYWAAKNIRLKMGRNGHLEIDLFAANLTEKSPEDDDDAEDIHLQALIKRKEAYVAEHPTEINRRQHPADDKPSLVSDISGNGFYNIVAELLYRTNVRSEVTDLYVTDYTENSLVSAYKPEGLKRALGGRPVPVFHIGAWDSRELVRDMEIGSIYYFADVRLSTDNDGGFKGNVKFADQRIAKVNVRKSEDPAVVALFKRKGEFKIKQAAAASQVSAVSPGEQDISGTTQHAAKDHETISQVVVSFAVKSRHTDQPKSSIKAIRETNKCPNKYRLLARIVDFYPMDINEFAVRRCRSCKKMIPDNRNACTMCDDMMQQYVEWIFRFFFILEDEGGDKFTVDVCSEAKTFLTGIQPCDLRADRERLMAVKRRLRGCLGNLVEVHEGIKRNETIDPEFGPFLDLAIKSWEVDDGVRKLVTYALTGCEAVEP